MASNSIDFKRAFCIANELLATARSITTFPYAIKDVIKDAYDLQFCSFAKASGKFKIDITAFGSESAVLIEKMGMNVIFYNQDEPKPRIRFSICHELGHYVQNHKMNLPKEDPLYGKQEIEANFFAAQILMPEQILRECIRRGKSTNVDFLISSFGVSEEAAEKRCGSLARTNAEYRSYSEKEYDDIILYKYADFINSIAPNKYLYSFEEELDRQRDRDGWMNDRYSRY